MPDVCGRHVQAYAGIILEIACSLIVSMDMIGNSQVGTASRRVTFRHSSHLEGPHSQPLNCAVFVAHTLATRPEMVLMLVRRGADAPE
jgi:hypothetical protein